MECRRPFCQCWPGSQRSGTGGGITIGARRSTCHVSRFFASPSPEPPRQLCWDRLYPYYQPSPSKVRSGGSGPYESRLIGGGQDGRHGAGSSPLKAARAISSRTRQCAQRVYKPYYSAVRANSILVLSAS
ncbi:hypothetical protein V8C26DRAFT_129799 [Trichoderma gracile]